MKKDNNNNHQVRKNKMNTKKKEENLDHFHIVRIIVTGERKTD